MTGAGASTWARRVLILTTAMVLLTLGAATALADPQPGPTPADTRLDIILTVSIAPAIVSAGDLVTIEGTITDQSDAAISGARLNVLLGGTESPDSLVVSDEAGTFQTFAEIPPDTPPGATDLVVSFAGDGSYTPGLKRFDVTVDDLPLGKDPSATTEPEASSTTDPPATANASGTPTPDTTVPAASPDISEDPSPLSWFYVALIVVGGIAVLIAAALVFRGMYGHKPPARLEDLPLESLLQPDDAADSEEGALLSDSFSEVDPAAENPSVRTDGEPPEHPPTPGRSLD